MIIIKLKFVFELVLQWSPEDIKRYCSVKLFIEYRLLGLLKYLFNGSPFQVLNAVYPNQFKEWDKIIYQISEIAARDYLKDSIISTITFAPKPIFYEENNCVLGGYIYWENSSGLKYKSKIDVFLKMKNRNWVAFMVIIDDTQPFTKETKEITHNYWNFLLRRKNSSK